MSVVEDVRQVIQDFLAPELRAMTARLDSFEKIMEQKLEFRFEATEARFLALEQKLEFRLDATDAKIDRLTEALNLDRRFSRLESQQPSVPQ